MKPEAYPRGQPDVHPGPHPGPGYIGDAFQQLSLAIPAAIWGAVVSGYRYYDHARLDTREEAIAEARRFKGDQEHLETVWFAAKMNERNDWMVVFKDNENPSRCSIVDIRSNGITGTIGDLSKCLAY